MMIRIRPSFLLNLRVLSALLIRELATSYGRHPGGHLWAVLQPVLMIFLLTIGFSLMFKLPALGTSFLLFYASGFLPLRVFQEVTASLGGAIRLNKPLLSYPRVTYVDVIASRAILSILTQLCVCLIILVGVFLYERLPLHIDLAACFLALSLTLFLAIGIGCINAFLMAIFPVWHTLWNIVTKPLIMISGVFFIFEGLPPLLQNILWFNPIMHLTSLMRTGFYPTYEPKFVSVIYVFLIGLICFAASLVFLKRYSKDILYR